MTEILNQISLFSIALSFIIGLVAGIHCVFMCGTFCSQSEQLNSKHKNGPWLYQIGRLFSYLVLGGLFYMFGELLVRPFLSIISNFALATVLTIILLGASICILKKTESRNLSIKNYINFINRFRHRFFKAIPNRFIALSIGALTALIPCGTLYIVLSMSFASNTFINGLLMICSFWLGTLPLMLSLHRALGRFKVLMIPSVRFGLLLIALGILLIRNQSLKVGINNIELWCNSAVIALIRDLQF